MPRRRPAPWARRSIFRPEKAGGGQSEGQTVAVQVSTAKKRTTYRGNSLAAWGVADGDLASVPELNTLFLLASGLAGLGGSGMEADALGLALLIPIGEGLCLVQAVQPSETTGSQIWWPSISRQVMGSFRLEVMT